MTTHDEFKMHDYRDVRELEVRLIRAPGASDQRYDLWVNIDGVCVLRVKSTAVSDINVDLAKEVVEGLWKTNYLQPQPGDA